ncbi:THAP domain containing protein, partial [Asbolus verrucosus]
MNFVISNVTTVEEDDEEPLYEIKKVSIFKEKKEYKIEPQSKVKVTTYKKSCYVPLCPNSSVATPDKMFITVPVNPVRRKQWLDVVGKTNGKNPKSPMFCCQDHFNLEKDMKNYEEHLRRGKVQMLLHQTVVPHIFICNQYGHLKRKERLEVLQKLHKKRNLDPLLAEDEDE